LRILFYGINPMPKFFDLSNEVFDLDFHEGRGHRNCWSKRADMEYRCGQLLRVKMFLLETARVIDPAYLHRPIHFCVPPWESSSDCGPPLQN